jgi:NAD(P)-dependent dehydrogenase (short-subunit alcohol dehydrogenase family)
VTGANRGIDCSSPPELTEAGAQVVAIVRSSSDELDALKAEIVVPLLELTDAYDAQQPAGQIMADLSTEHNSTV